MSTSAKGTYEWYDKYEFLTDAERREYGAVLKMTMPGHLSAVVQWTGKLLSLEFLVYADRLVVRQDGREIGASRFVLSDPRRLRNVKTTRGKGIFGPLAGKLIGR
ncbi:MAG: hypothetical protein CMJ69_03880 [Planctomycetaceae bacterium]|nr:hypothetical protein [Planctomycetaceae bacterium]